MLAIKGRRGRRPVWSEISPRGDVIGLAGEIVGRDEELAHLTGFLQTAERGPAALFIEGEAGVGKTTLCQAGVDQAVERGFEVLACRPAQSEARLSYAGLADLLTPVLDSILDQLPDPQRTALEVALLRRRPATSAWDQRTVAAGTLSMLRALAGAGPVLIAVDDLQWIDRPSARVISFALRRVAGERVGFMATLRTGLPSPVVLDSSLAASGLTDRISVGGLSPGAVERLLRSRWGATFSRPTLLKLHRASSGNPFFALELARTLLDRKQSLAPGEPLPIPENLKALLRERLARLPAGTRNALLLAALLQTATERLIEDAGASVARLDAAVSAGIVTTDDGLVCFSHPLLAAALVEETPPRRRREAHRRLAAVVAEPEERARHLALGASGPDEAVAVALEQAAGLASARGAPDAAAELAELSVRFTTSGEGEFRRRRLQAATYRFEAGDTTRAKQLLDEILATVPAGQDRAEALRRLGSVLYRVEGWRSAIDPLTEALAQPSVDRDLQVRALCDLSWAREMTGEMPAALAAAEAALDLAEDLDNPALLSLALAGVGMARFFLGDGTSLDLLERAAAIEDWSDPLAVERRPTNLLATALKWSDRFDDARSRFLALERYARERGDDGSLVLLLCQMAELECWAGDYELAHAYASRSHEVTLQIGAAESLGGAALYVRSLVDGYTGDLESARALASAGLAISERADIFIGVVINRGVLGFVELSAGNAAGTDGYLAQLADMMAAAGLPEPSLARFLPDEIEALVALGDLTRADGFTRLLEERAMALDRPWALATSARCRGLVMAARGDADSALRALGEALAHHHRLPMPFERGRTLLVKGQVERRARHWGAARTSLREALQVFEALGARLWADRAREELARIGGRPATTSELTETERRVAELVATGVTNQEAADALFVSPRTVQSNLARVFRKLGVRSRSELAARLRPESTGRPDSRSQQ